MLWILASLLAGVLLGLWPHTPGLVFRLSRVLTALGLIFLLFFMGASLGSHPSIVSQLQWIGLKAFLLALFSVIGSIGVVFCVERALLPPASPEDGEGR